MKISLLKKLIAVSLAFATLMFAGCSKDEPVNEENPSENISQNVDESESTSQNVESTDKEETESTEKEETSKKEESLGYIPEGPGIVEVKKPDIMDNTIDLLSKT